MRHERLVARCAFTTATPCLIALPAWPSEGVRAERRAAAGRFAGEAIVVERRWTGAVLPRFGVLDVAMAMHLLVALDVEDWNRSDRIKASPCAPAAA